jgi:hypothetical protein
MWHHKYLHDMVARDFAVEPVTAWETELTRDMRWLTRRHKIGCADWRCA